MLPLLVSSCLYNVRHHVSIAIKSKFYIRVLLSTFVLNIALSTYCTSVQPSQV